MVKLLKSPFFYLLVFGAFATLISIPTLIFAASYYLHPGPKLINYNFIPVSPVIAILLLISSIFALNGKKFAKVSSFILALLLIPWILFHFLVGPFIDPSLLGQPRL